ncbi:MAG: serine/threonine protein kinase, partial [Cyanobacteria bacterium P01_G01_bin.49]
ITNSASPYELFGLEQSDYYYGVLIKLKPLKIQRIALTFRPKFIIAQTWGYGLADEQGNFCLLNRDGQCIGQFELSLTITAMTSFGEFGLLIASYSHGEGKLSTLDLSSIISKSPLDTSP